MQLQGIIDLHIHTAPDTRPRRFTAVQQAQLARDVGAMAIVLKSHATATMQRAAGAQRAVPEVRVFGGITLNESVGGIDPPAVKLACEQGARVIWLPTLDARNHRAVTGGTGGIDVMNGSGLSRPMGEIMRIAADFDVALATGHLSSAEACLVVEGAARAGVRRIVVTHPEHSLVNMPIVRQLELARSFPVFFERCYCQPSGGGEYRTNVAANLAAIREVGFDSTIIATDSGQMETDPWDVALGNYLQFLSAHGVSAEMLAHMTQAAPAFACGLRHDDPRASLQATLTAQRP